MEAVPPDSCPTGWTRKGTCSILALNPCVEGIDICFEFPWRRGKLAAARAPCRKREQGLSVNLKARSVYDPQEAGDYHFEKYLSPQQKDH